MKKFLILFITLSFCLTGCNNKENNNNSENNSYNYTATRTSNSNNVNNENINKDSINDNQNTNSETELSSFSTKIYTPNDKARQNNIRITCSTLNGSVIKPRRDIFFL